MAARGNTPRHVPAHLRTTFAARLRERRRMLGLSQHVVAERAGVSTEFVSRMERGATLPSLPTLMSLCRVLGCTPNDLLVAAKSTRAPLEDRIEHLRQRLERASPPAARQALRVAEAMLEYEARSPSGRR